jgi:hypothetical protein
LVDANFSEKHTVSIFRAEAGETDVDANVSEKHTVSIFRAEAGDM